MKGLWIAPVFTLCMTGCVVLPTTETKPPANPPVTAKQVTVKQAVTVDQINDDNAKEMSLAFEAELEQAQTAPVIAPETTPPAPKAK